jgi:hypothetical protein
VLEHLANPLQLFFSFCLNWKFVALFSKSIEFFLPGSFDPYYDVLVTACAAGSSTETATAPMSAAAIASIPTVITRVFVV